MLCHYIYCCSGKFINKTRIIQFVGDISSLRRIYIYIHTSSHTPHINCYRKSTLAYMLNIYLWNRKISIKQFPQSSLAIDPPNLPRRNAELTHLPLINFAVLGIHWFSRVQIWEHLNLFRLPRQKITTLLYKD